MFLRGAGIVGVGLLAGLIGWVGGCGEGAESANRYVIVTGGTGGVYYPTGGAIGRLVRQGESGLRLDVRSSGGSVANARQLASGSADFAIMQNDIASYARNGERMFEQPIETIVGVAALYPEHIQVVADADAGITELADLRGKRVAIGAIGSGTEGNALQLLEAVGLTTDDLASVERLKAAESADYLRDGRVDAAFFTFGVGASAIHDLVNRGNVTLVPVAGDVRQKLIDRYGFYREAVIPADAYGAGYPAADVPTVSVMATLVARSEVPADVVASVLGSVFDDLDEFKRAHARLRDVSRKRAGQMNLPLHAGAQAFYGGE